MNGLLVNIFLLLDDVVAQSDVDCPDTSSLLLRNDKASAEFTVCKLEGGILSHVELSVLVLLKLSIIWYCCKRIFGVFKRIFGVACRKNIFGVPEGLFGPKI